MNNACGRSAAARTRRLRVPARVRVCADAQYIILSACVTRRTSGSSYDYAPAAAAGGGGDNVG